MPFILQRKQGPNSSTVCQYWRSS